MITAVKLKWIEEGTKNPLIASEVLFQAALEEFSSHSFKDASLNAIIKAAHFNKGSFYYRFYDKLDLYLSLLYRMGEEKLALFEQYDRTNTVAGFFDSVRQKVELGLRFAKKEPRYTALWRRVLVEEPSVRKAIDDCFGRLSSSVWAEMVQRAKESGELRGDLSTATMATIVTTLMNHLDIIVPSELDEARILLEINNLLEVLKHGLKA